MTRKDYVLLAAALAAAHPQHDRETYSVEHFGGWLDAVYSLANALKADNIRFDRARFLTACGALAANTLPGVL